MWVRIVTAAIGIPILSFASLSESGWPMRGLVILLVALAMAEFLKAESQPKNIVIYLSFIGFVSVVICWQRPMTTLHASLATLALMLFLPLLFGKDRQERGDWIFSSGLWIAWVLLPMLMVLNIKQYALAPSGALFDMLRGSTIFVVFLCLWAGDSMAYFCGRAFGKRKLAPHISPNKTWEGAICNLLAAALVGGLAGTYIGIEVVPALAIGIICGICGQVGDLFQSAWKRGHDLKDSGALLPGHGGVLDRFDSLLFSAPFVALLLTIF